MLAKSFKTSFNRNIFYKLKPGIGAPILFLNGLSDSMSSWVEVVELLEASHNARPFLFVDLIGQGLALESEMMIQSQSSNRFEYNIQVEEQTQCLIELIEHLNIKKLGLIGFSYGGGIALNFSQLRPNAISELILIAPFLLRLDLAFPLSRVILWYFKFLKSMTPSFLKFPYSIVENSYSQFVRHYMNFRFSQRVSEVNKRDIIIQMSEGIMKFNIFDKLKNLPHNKLQLVSCDLDTLIPKSLMHEFWYKLDANQRVSWTQIQDGEHLLIEQNSFFVAKLIESLLSEVSDLNANDSSISANHKNLKVRSIEIRHFSEFKPSYQVFRAQI